MELKSHGKTLSLNKPLVMGILNVTPDSFSDGGKFNDPSRAVERALQMIESGADIIDIGGESTGPNSKDVAVEEELTRVMPVLIALRSQTHAWISIDTYKSRVAAEALEAGADMINDVTALRGDSELAKVLADYPVPVVLMFSKDSTARTTREEVQYRDVVKTVTDFLKERVEFAARHGISRDRLILDPGMGAFVSSDPQYSLQLLNNLEELVKLGYPVLAGPSRKSFIGQVLDVPLDQRLEGSLAACAVAVMNGASILRVHDVQQTRRVVDMVSAIMIS